MRNKLALLLKKISKEGMGVIEIKESLADILSQIPTKDLVMEKLSTLPGLIEEKELDIIIYTDRVNTSKEEITEYRRRVEEAVEKDKDNDLYKEKLSNAEKRRHELQRRLNESEEYNSLISKKTENSVMLERITSNLEKAKREFRAACAMARLMGAE